MTQPHSELARAVSGLHLKLDAKDRRIDELQTRNLELAKSLGECENRISELKEQLAEQAEYLKDAENQRDAATYAAELKGDEDRERFIKLEGQATSHKRQIAKLIGRTREQAARIAELESEAKQEAVISERLYKRISELADERVELRVALRAKEQEPSP